jgi:hypothetical protein
LQQVKQLSQQGKAAVAALFDSIITSLRLYWAESTPGK